MVLAAVDVPGLGVPAPVTGKFRQQCICRYQRQGRKPSYLGSAAQILKKLRGYIMNNAVLVVLAQRHCSRLVYNTSFEP